MPYVITTTRNGYYCHYCGPGCEQEAHSLTSRRAVATLNEVADVVDSGAADLHHQILEATYAELSDALPIQQRVVYSPGEAPSDDVYARQILAAFNAAQGAEVSR